MKKIVIILILLVGGQISAQKAKSVFSKEPIVNLENFQKQKLHFGFYVGFNTYNYKIEYKHEQPQEIQVEKEVGFNVGMIANKRLSDNFDLRFEPGLYYATRNLFFPPADTGKDSLREAVSANINFPLLLKYSAVRTGNIRPYLVTGLSVTLNLSSNHNSIDDNSAQKFRVQKWSPNYEFGAGIDLFFQYFIFSPSVRGIIGLQDELVRDNDPNSPWTGNIESMKTRAFVLNLSFH